METYKNDILALQELETTYVEIEAFTSTPVAFTKGVMIGTNITMIVDWATGN